MKKNLSINSLTREELSEYIFDLGEKNIELNSYGNGYTLMALNLLMKCRI